MQVTLFRALRSVNIDDEIAQKAVEAVEEHIEMAVGQAVKPLENKIDTLMAKIDVLSTKIETVNTGMASAVSNVRADILTLKWLGGATATVIAAAGAAAAIAAKLPL